MTRESVLANRDVRPSAFVHFVLKTNRFEEQVSFYKQLLNAWEVFSSRGVSFLTYDDEHHRIAIAQVEGISDLNPKTAGFEHIAYAFSTLGDLLANYVRLKEKDILPYWCINHGMTTSLYYRDIDGNQIETQTDNFDTHEELVGYFHTDEFRAEPLGVQFDPDRLIELYRDGVPEVELKRQGIAPRAPGTEFVFPF
jgi:catechol-2,3-dioxygenase